MGKRRQTKKRPARKQRRERRHNAPGRPVPLSVVGNLQRLWPFHEVLVSESWQGIGQLTQLIVSRRAEPTGDIVAGVLLVDLGCLGVKNGFLCLLSPSEYGHLVTKLSETQPMIRCSPDLAAKIVLTGLEYADSLGFRPHLDAVDAFSVLLGADASACEEEVPVGNGEGKPLYIAGPDDNVRFIMATLDRVVGPEGYGYVIGDQVMGGLPVEESGELDKLDR